MAEQKRLITIVEGSEIWSFLSSQGTEVNKNSTSYTSVVSSQKKKKKEEEKERKEK